jgi:hypothetical protein
LFFHIIAFLFCGFFGALGINGRRLFLEFYRFLLAINGDIKICFLKWFWLVSALKTDLFFKAIEVGFP